MNKKKLDTVVWVLVAEKWDPMPLQADRPADFKFASCGSGVPQAGNVFEQDAHLYSAPDVQYSTH